MPKQVVHIKPLGSKGINNYADPRDDCRPVMESIQYTELDRRRFELSIKNNASETE
jgi:hypothetical protein